MVIFFKEYVLILKDNIYLKTFLSHDIKLLSIKNLMDYYLFFDFYHPYNLKSFPVTLYT